MSGISYSKFSSTTLITIIQVFHIYVLWNKLQDYQKWKRQCFNNISGEAYFRLRLKNWNLFQLKYVDLNNPPMLWKKDDQIRFLGIRHLPFSNISLRWKMFQLSCYRMKNVIIVKYITKLKWKLLAPAFCLLLTFLR